MWDERVVGAIVKAAREDLQQQKWARDFADKLRQRGITVEQVLRTASLQSFIVIGTRSGLLSAFGIQILVSLQFGRL